MNLEIHYHNLFTLNAQDHWNFFSLKYKFNISPYNLNLCGKYKYFLNPEKEKTIPSEHSGGIESPENPVIDPAKHK